VSTDESFREIQLNGKQLVFLFMAATVVSVVIFLMGVLVGRDVRGRADRTAAPEAASATVAPDVGTASPALAAATPGPAAEPPAPADELTYFDRLQKNNTPQETLKSSTPAPGPVVKPAPQTSSPPAPSSRQPSVTETHPASLSGGEPTGPGFAVQVTTAPDRRSADTLVKQLIKKGYPAFVSGPVSSSGRSIYRIRVGKYKDRREAEAVSHRLETEEQFKPWIAR